MLGCDAESEAGRAAAMPARVKARKVLNFIFRDFQLTPKTRYFSYS
jgi:hypothetical protein